MSQRFNFYRTLGYSIEVPDSVVIAHDIDGNADAEALCNYMEQNDKWPNMIDYFDEEAIKAYAIINAKDDQR